MNPETIKQIEESLKPLAEKIGQGGEKAFELAIRNVYVAAIQEILLFILTIALVIVSTKLAKKYWIRAKKEWLEAEMVIGLIIVGIIFIVGLFMFFDAISRLINPQWYAIKDIIEMFKVNK